MFTLSISISRLTRHISEWTMCVLLGLLTGWMLINLVTGCGIKHTNVNGASHFGDCVLVPWVETK